VAEAQSKIGWRHFLEGFAHIGWKTILQEHLDHNRSRKYATNLLSQLQRKYWLIFWELWDHRNKDLHSLNHNIHNESLLQLNKEILHEWTLGRDMLDAKFLHLFEYDLIKLLKYSIHYKTLWLFTLWNARDTFIGPNRLRKGTILKFNLWKKKISRTPERDQVQTEIVNHNITNNVAVTTRAQGGENTLNEIGENTITKKKEQK